MYHIAHINLAKEFRGGERQTALLISELSKLGFRQTLFFRSGETLLKNYLINLQVQNLNFIDLSKPFFMNLKIFANQNIDLIHAHEAKASQISYFINKFYKIPYIITRRVQNNPSNNFFNKAIYNNASKVVAISNIIREDLLKIFPDLNIVKISSAYSSDLKNANENIIFNDIPKDKKIIGHIGAIVDNHKGTCTILETAKLLEQERKNVHFIIIGNGSDLELCETRARYLTNISFLGFKDEPQKYIKQFDIFVFPSIHEGLGSILLDVMRFGKPIIASAVGGILDLIENDKNGYLIQPKDSQMLKNKIVKLLDNRQELEEFSVENKIRALEFSPNKMAEKYSIIYHGVLM